MSIVDDVADATPEDTGHTDGIEAPTTTEPKPTEIAEKSTAVSAGEAAASPEPYVVPADWATPQVEERVQGLLDQMSLEEKVAFVTGDLNWNYGFYSGPVERLGIPALQMADGPAGVRINRGDVHGGKATALPAPIALAATWDPDLAYDYGTVIGVECRLSDHNVSLGPAVDIARVPVGGRTFESYGEDPVLTSRMGVGVVRGVQAQGVQACGKHFAMNNQEDSRDSISSVVDERTMMELYMPPFEALVREGNVASMMAAFNRVNGEYSTENRHILTDILRDRFGFKGWVMSDYVATHSTVESANAGLDQEQPSGEQWAWRLVEAVRDGRVAESTIDDKVRNILRPLIGLGQIEHPPTISEFPVDVHHEIAQKIAEVGMVLLKNDGILPLHGVQSVALIGSDVDTVGAQGGGSSLVQAAKGVNPADGLSRALPDAEIKVAYGVDPITTGALLTGPDPIPSTFFTTLDGNRGLHAEYWTNTDFSGHPLISRDDAQVDLYLGFVNFPGFNGCSPRYEKLPQDLCGRISARFTGYLTVPTSGAYRLAVTSLGTFSFSLDGDVVLSSETESTSTDEQPAPGGASFANAYGMGSGWGAASEETREYEIELVAGQRYQIRLDYSANDPAQGFLIGARIRLGWTPPPGVISTDVTDAAQLAASCDAAVVVVRNYETEATDRADLRLPNGQVGLIQAVTAANPRTIVVVMTGSPSDFTGWGDNASAIIQAWYPGQAQGDALARLLTGEIGPQGRLPLTLPADLAQTPVANKEQYPGVDGKANYTEGLLVGYRAYDTLELEPAYPFGHGLDYTSYDYSDLNVVPAEGDTVATVSCTIRNIGERAGTETVQIYVGELPTAVFTPCKQLAGFAKVHLEAGESTSVEVPIPRRSVSYFDVGQNDWVTPTGTVELLAGSSSRDIRLTTPLAVR